MALNLIIFILEFLHIHNLYRRSSGRVRIILYAELSANPSESLLRPLIGWKLAPIHQPPFHLSFRQGA